MGLFSKLKDSGIKEKLQGFSIEMGLRDTDPTPEEEEFMARLGINAEDAVSLSNFLNDLEEVSSQNDVWLANNGSIRIGSNPAIGRLALDNGEYVVVTNGVPSDA